MALALGSRFRSSNHLILAGVVINFFCSSLVMLLQYFAEPSEMISLFRWYMGSLSVVGFRPALWIAPVFIFAARYTYKKNAELDLFWLGEELSRSKGLDFYRTRNTFICLYSFLIACCVSFVGPVGFIGIVIPHMSRLLFGFRHKKLCISSVLLGGVFLTLCDLLSRWLMAPSEIPVGVVTALIGSPIFLLLLFKSRHEL